MNLSAMRTSMTLDDAQLEQALQALVERESASRLVALGSSQPHRSGTSLLGSLLPACGITMPGPIGS